MFDFGFSAETDRPAEGRIGNQSEIREVGGRKKVGINFDEGAQNAFGHHFGAHRSVEEKIEAVRGPFWDLSGVDLGFRWLISLCRGGSRGCNGERCEGRFHRRGSEEIAFADVQQYNRSHVAWTT